MDGQTRDSSSSVFIILLCNESMRKRCQTLATDLQTSCGKTSRVCLSTRVKCVTYVEHATGGGAISFSEATDRILASASMVLCLLRVTILQPDACRQLTSMLAARHSSHLPAERVLLIQCCGAAYAVQRASGMTSGCRLDTNPAVVDFCLRAWLADCLGCNRPDFQFVSVENSTVGKAARHRLFNRRYTMHLEFTASRASRRRSLYRLTEGQEAENGGCSPAAVLKRRMSVGDCLDSGQQFGHLDGSVDNAELLFQLDPTAECSGVCQGGGSVTLVVCASNSCSKEAELCLNNLSSRGHRALTIEDFVAKQSRRLSSSSLLLGAGGRLSRLLSQLTPSAAAGAVLLLLCRGTRSRLLADFLVVAASTTGTAALAASLPRACFVVLIDPVSDAESRKLQLLATDGSVSPRCQLDVVCSPEGLRGSRVIDCLMSDLAVLVRQLEVSKRLPQRRSSVGNLKTVAF